MVAMALLAAALMPPRMSIAGGPQHTGKAPHWRTLTFTKETTTSKCIGKPVTPICAVETFRACFKRKQIELCRMVSLNGESEKFEALGLPSPDRKTEYTIIKYQTIRHAPPRPKNMGPGGEEFDEKPGDVRVDITVRSCALTRETCAGEPTESFFYLIRHVGDRWVIYDYSAYDQPE
jgi:hypothetical protein